MNTAVQLLSPKGESPRLDLLHGEPRQIVAGSRGPVALFSSGELVAYRLRYRRRTRLLVFRTLDVDDRLAAAVPGVRPRVQLLLDLRTEGRARLVRRLFAYLVKTGRSPRELPDVFYLRVGVLLGGRLPPQKILLSLLSPPLQPAQVSTAGSPPATQAGSACSRNRPRSSSGAAAGLASAPRSARASEDTP